ncbi:MAG: DUF429 domain-containing protein [Alphaproteobacteria bacterium]
MSELVVGVDGCRGGWIAVLAPISGSGCEARLFRDFGEILSSETRIIAIDVPIGLPEIAIRGGRVACNEARSRLGARQSSVFSVPARAALAAKTYREACAINLENSDPPRKIAKQTYNILPRIAEVDAVMTPALEPRVFECHPELAFWVMNDQRPLALPKKMKSRPYAEGMALRRRLLAKAGIEVPPPPKAVQGISFGEDDLLDACACAIAARRIALGQAITLPADPPRDAKGLRMAIMA